MVSGEGGSESLADTGHVIEENDELCKDDMSKGPVYLSIEGKGRDWR